jgi:ribosome maturation factor RimP
MMKKDPVEHIKELSQTLVRQEDMFVVDVEIKQQDMNVVWVYVDSETGGVNLDECSRISRELSLLVESEEIFTTSYRLNVSSPGLSRPLSDKRQYAKNRGRTAKVKYKQEDDYKKIKGVLKEVSDEYVKVQHEEGNETSIRFENLVETKIVPNI